MLSSKMTLSRQKSSGEGEVEMTITAYFTVSVLTGLEQRRK